MKRKSVFFLGAACFALLVVTGVGLLTGRSGRVGAGRGAPAYRVAPLWPQPFPDDSWVIGSVSGVTVDSQNHVWVVHRGNDSLEGNEKGMIPTAGRGGASGPPSSSVCCISAPVILEYDAAGKYLSGFGGPSSTYAWPQTTGGIAVDGKGNVWIAAAGADTPPPAAGRGRGAAPAAARRAPPVQLRPLPDAVTGPAALPPPPAPPPPPPPAADAHVLKFSRNGLHMLTIGTPGKMDGADSQTHAQSSGRDRLRLRGERSVRRRQRQPPHRRVRRRQGHLQAALVRVRREGRRRRGRSVRSERAGREVVPRRDAASRSRETAWSTSATRAATASRCSTRAASSSRKASSPRTPWAGSSTGSFGAPLNAAGSVWDVAFSSDPQQRFLFVADGQNKKVRIVNRDTLTEVGAFGSGGRYPGQFLAVAAIATDAQGNVYTGELHHGKRVQKFTPGK